MSSPVRPELGRAWERYFGRRGGQTPKPAPDVLGVVQFDDMAAYPPFRRWYAGRRNAAPVAANFDYHAIYNTDPLGTGSVVVVEDFQASPTYWVTIMGVAELRAMAGFTLEDEEGAGDGAQEKEQNITQPRIENVRIIIAHGTEFAGLALSGFLDGRTQGPWTLNPQNALVVVSDQLAVQMLSYFRGRYYPRP